ncbi:hypothetical protein VNO78_33266 [Psophocarpus tetragonolobus]|uniref:Uncharacterized protein n=1 Tax=Psophocarpus tetragonolobus TaxID=3891 RepID=A0AAN9RQ05_PSOTE
MKPNSNNFTFEFPTLLSVSDVDPPNDVVFCGRVMVHQTDQPPLMERSNSFNKPNPVRSAHRRWGWLPLPATRYSRLQKSGSGGGGGRRRVSGMFGVIKFPLQMELNDMRKRQTKIAMTTMTMMTSEDKAEKGEKSGWKLQLVRMLRRKGREWLNALSTSSFDF